MKLHTATASTWIAVALFFGAQGLAEAKSACSPLDQPTCSTDQSCRWIAPYKRTDGKEVKGYCRSAPAAKAAKVAPTTPAAPVAAPVAPTQS
jgi:hypothetical protein